MWSSATPLTECRWRAFLAGPASARRRRQRRPHPVGGTQNLDHRSFTGAANLAKLEFVVECSGILIVVV
jgi:hypothetical protein